MPVNAVTFESPGSKEVIKNLKFSGNLDGLDILNYVTYSNMEYILNHYIGTVHCIKNAPEFLRLRLKPNIKRKNKFVSALIIWLGIGRLPKHLLPIRHFLPALQFFLKEFYRCRFELEQRSDSSLILDVLKKKWQVSLPSKIVESLLNFKLIKNNTGSLFVVFEPGIVLFRRQLSAWLAESKACPFDLLTLPSPTDIRIKSVDNRPADQEYAYLVQYTFQKKDLKMGDCLWQNPSWIVYLESRQQDYRGVIYVNNSMKQVVLVHQGTSLSGNILDFDLHKKAFANFNGRQNAAFTFLKVAVEAAQDFNFHLSFTGYLWGGVLAELSVFYCHTELSYMPVNAVTFESPGSKKILEDFLSLKDLNNLDILGYVTNNNRYYSRYYHTGTVYRIPNYLDHDDSLVWGEARVCSIDRMLVWFKVSNLLKQRLAIRHFSPLMQSFLKDFYEHRLKLEQSSDSFVMLGKLYKKWQVLFPAKIVEKLINFKLVKNNEGVFFVIFEPGVEMFRRELSAWLVESKARPFDLFYQAPIAATEVILPSGFNSTNEDNIKFKDVSTGSMYSEWFLFGYKNKPVPRMRYDSLLGKKATTSASVRRQHTSNDLSSRSRSKSSKF